jgi:hypothetical protein
VHASLPVENHAGPAVRTRRGLSAFLSTFEQLARARRKQRLPPGGAWLQPATAASGKPRLGGGKSLRAGRRYAQRSSSVYRPPTPPGLPMERRLQPATAAFGKCRLGGGKSLLAGRGYAHARRAFADPLRLPACPWGAGFSLRLRHLASAGSGAAKVSSPGEDTPNARRAFADPLRLPVCPWNAGFSPPMRPTVGSVRSSRDRGCRSVREGPGRRR